MDKKVTHLNHRNLLVLRVSDLIDQNGHVEIRRLVQKKNYFGCISILPKPDEVDRIRGEFGGHLVGDRVVFTHSAASELAQLCVDKVRVKQRELAILVTLAAMRRGEIEEKEGLREQLRLMRRERRTVGGKKPRVGDVVRYNWVLENGATRTATVPAHVLEVGAKGLRLMVCNYFTKAVEFVEGVQFGRESGGNEWWSW